MPATAFGHRPSIPYKPIPSGHPICVVATYNTVGQIRVDSFGVEVDGMRYRYKITSCFLFKELKGILVYQCTYEDVGTEKHIRFNFYTADCRWTVA